MSSRRGFHILLAVSLLVILFPVAPAQAATATFSNPTAIPIPATDTSGPGSPYPSTISVSGLPTGITRVTVTLHGINHTWPDDIDILLVGPGGENTLLMSDVGGGTDLVNVTLSFDDAATQSLPDSTAISSGTFRPTNPNSGDLLPAPAPAGPYAASLSVFNGTNPNGEWRLYAYDDLSADTGSIAGGWSLTITTAGASVASPPWDPGDGRLNPEPAAPLAIYCGAESIYAYIPGYLEFDFPLGQVGAAGETSLLTTGVTGARLYQLSTGELQVNLLHDSEEYVFTWDACPATQAITRAYNAATGELLAEYVRTF